MAQDDTELFDDVELFDDTALAPAPSVATPVAPAAPAPWPKGRKEPRLTAGVDEAGRGPLAGPLVVAAVILDPARRIDGINDSKLLTEAEREALYARIVRRALHWSVVVVEVEEIDRLNIFHATMAGMTRALATLGVHPELALIDGNVVPRGLPWPARAIVGGDATRLAIGAASILAKVTRDRLMVELDAHHPHYGFARHKGYSTPEHLDALRRHGPCGIHRRSYAPVREAATPSLFHD